MSVIIVATWSISLTVVTRAALLSKARPAQLVASATIREALAT
jgi:hypothetical protein